MASYLLLQPRTAKPHAVPLNQLRGACAAIVILGLIALLILPACMEIPPPIDYTPVDISLIDTSFVDPAIPAKQDRIVLVEEFTGVQCVNCPTGHATTEQIIANNPGRVAVIALHNYFAGPFPFSIENYIIEEAEALDDFLGPAIGWPAATIDRVDRAAEGGLIVVDAAKWEGYVTGRLGEPTLVNITLTPDWEASSRTFTVLADIRFTEAVSDEVKISVMLLESDIVDAQTTLSGVDTFYVHEHVMRDMLTPFIGQSVSTTTEAGRVIQKEYRRVLDDQWVAEAMEVVLFVHYTGTSKEVLQAAHVDLTD